MELLYSGQNNVIWPVCGIRAECLRNAESLQGEDETRRNGVHVGRKRLEKLGKYNYVKLFKIFFKNHIPKVRVCSVLHEMLVEIKRWRENSVAENKNPQNSKLLS